MAGERILMVVHGNAVVSAALAEQLGRTGEFVVLRASGIADSEDRAGAATIDLVLTAAALPDGSAADLVVRLRSVDMVEPIVVLAGSDETEAAMSALDAGADDRETVPVRIRTLLERIRVHLRKREAGQDAAVPLGRFVFRPGLKLLTMHDRRIRLTDKEAAILRYLHRAAAPVAREELLSEVWGYNSGVTTHTVETHIYRLRQKIEADPAQAALLVTDAGGYRLVC